MSTVTAVIVSIVGHAGLIVVAVRAPPPAHHPHPLTLFATSPTLTRRSTPTSPIKGEVKRDKSYPLPLWERVPKAGEGWSDKGEAPPPPAYPELARTMGIEGDVKLRVTLNARGEVEDAVVISGLGYGLDESALAWIKHYPFESVSSVVESVVRFELD